MKDRILEYKELTQKYRELAARILPNEISVNWYGGIQIVESGAFVECTLFVPKEKLNEN